MARRSSTALGTTSVRQIAPEDFRRGMYLAVLYEVRQRVPFFSLDDFDHGRIKPISIALLPWEDEDGPLKVIDACLPFVFLQTALGDHKTLDVRRQRFALLDEQYARRVVKRLRARDRETSRSSRRDD